MLLAQHQIEVSAKVIPETHEIHIKQKIVYNNNSTVTLNEIYLNDWISSFSNPNSPLTKKFLNEFQTQLYIAKQNDRGFTNIKTIQNSDSQELLEYHRTTDQPDILIVKLDQPILPNKSITINLSYVLQIQSDRFTGYGVNKHNEFLLNSWYLTPCVFENNQWKRYSNYNFDDLYTPKSDVKLLLDLPKTHYPNTALNSESIVEEKDRLNYVFTGKNIAYHKIFLNLKPFKKFKINGIDVQTNISHKKIDTLQERLYFGRAFDFLRDKYGCVIPSEITLSDIELKKNNLYGLALLPDILSPFSKEFKYELVIVKNVIKQYLDTEFQFDSREDYWLKNGIQMLLFMDYIDSYYPEQKLIGKLSKIWGLRHFNFSKLKYNEQYKQTYYQMMRLGRDQALTLPRERLLNFNERFTSYYKSAISLMYLNDYIGGKNQMDWIREYLSYSSEKKISTDNFRQFTEYRTSKNLTWFFDSFLTQYFNADYKIKTIEKLEDSTIVTLKNLRKGAYPVTLTTKKDTIEISNQWIEGFLDEKKISLPHSDANTFVLNQDNNTPEFNLKNNIKLVDKKLGLNKPLQINLFRDVEDPNYNQLYLIPIAEFQNVYDGVKIGINFNNQGLLAKPLIYAITPTYGTQSKSVTGSAKIVINTFHESDKIFHSKYGVTLDRSSFNYGDFITKIQPFAQFTFLNPNNLRSNASSKLTFRYINIQKDNSSSFLDDNEIPPYQVFNVRYMNVKNDIEDFKSWQLDAQVSKEFGKLNMSYEIRKRTTQDGHYNLRFFMGTFLYNSLPNNEINFSYALDRPTDYLFEYNYLGQSESTGFLSQQLVVADGGFKSKLEPAFANQWMTTINASASIWRYVQAYGDIGLVKNKDQNLFFGYDSGIRIDLVTDYFELYFPLYSNLGWEISQSSYADKIRFVLTTDLTKLSSLLTRKWF